LAERGRRRLHPGFVSPDQEARSLSVPDEGAAFNGWTRSDEGRRQCWLDHVWVCPSGPFEEARWLSSKIAAVERWKARLPRAKGRRVAFAKVPQVLTCAQPALRLPQGRQTKTPVRGRGPGGSPGGSDKEVWRSARFRRVETKTYAGDAT
jgi:hypothetical protein